MELHQINVSKLTGVGPAISEKLARLGIFNLQDLLFHLPHRYEDRTRCIPIGQLRPGQKVLTSGVIEHSEVVYTKRRSLICRLSDGTGFLDIRLFYFSRAQQEKLKPGQALVCFGDVVKGRSYVSMIHPELEFVKDHQTVEKNKTLTPIYPVTEGLKQFSLRQLTDQALAFLEKTPLADYLDEDLLKDQTNQYVSTSLQEALTFIHRPPVGVDLAMMETGEHPSKQRLAFEELLAHQLSLLRIRSQCVKEPALKIKAQGQFNTDLKQSLPFELTNAQNKVIAEILQDISKPSPMLRLVQGDVGSGKTLVAACAALQVIEAGYQVALMVPTEILAEQHWNQFSQWFETLGLTCAYLVSKLKASERRQSLADIQSGRANIIIGTHALFQEQVIFKQLAMIIVDEQHRFGVHQRLALKDKSQHLGIVPHQLVMTATPIPRTLAMTAYADLDVSVIDELPPGRKPVTTIVISNERRSQIIQRIQHVFHQEQCQVYWVCTLIEESEELQCQAAENTLDLLAEQLPGLQVGLVHGRMKAVDKHAVMEQFKSGAIHCLVATTVIEVGVDVPNASLMVIENPERLGLAQLHQLRGRVGRGTAESHCVLMYHPPLSMNGKRRLDIMRQTNDGFKIAEKDLEIRGPGDILGTRQTGLVDFKIADIMRDRALIAEVSEIAKTLSEKEPKLADKIIRRWLGERETFAQV